MSAQFATVGSLLVRQVGAYGDLIGEDLHATAVACRSRLWVGAAVAASGVFFVEMACLGLIAAAWDTPGRLWTIGALGGFFLVALIVAAFVWGRIAAAPLQFLANTRFEWRKDRELIEEFAASSGGRAGR